ncbi:hypothetical protein [Hyphomonas sp.]|jgi:hypothetical protein|uniref:hypothetical protein n=1 Tax=Hyphomonas sp. TaxID=87 RepID=UPI0025B97FCB|nr:hypothetical protein [Hyphomonas sp.]
MRGADRYSALSADSILTTLSRLGDRVRERFPDRGLTGVCAELQRIAEAHVKRVVDVSKPHLLLRGLVALVLLAGLFMAGVGVEQKVRQLMINPDAIGFEGIEAIANILILMGAAIWFLLNLETRIKRSQALGALHELRSIAHVIDMHQLTKDPASLLGAGRTASSPDRDLSPADLMRYLDYCTEMLSLTGKLAALCMQSVRDEVVIHTVNEIEGLTTNLSSKIWQKIMIIRSEIDLPVPKS